MAKAKFVKCIKVIDRFNPLIIKQYEYRGCTYVITFNGQGEYIGIYHDIVGEHKAKQIEIDERLDGVQCKATEDAEKGFELFYKYCEEDEKL